MNQPIAAAAVQAVATRPNATQSFLVTVRLVEPKQESRPTEMSDARSYPDDSLTERQKTLIFQLISQHFWDKKEREYELAKVAGFSRADADTYIKSLLIK